MTKILLAVGDDKQFQSITDSMKMTQLQKEWAELLDTGDAVIQHGSTEPVPVLLNDYSLEKDVSDRELKQAMETEWRQLDYTPAIDGGNELNDDPQKNLDAYG